MEIYHRITEWLVLEGTLMIIKFQAPVVGRVATPDQAALPHPTWP